MVQLYSENVKSTVMNQKPTDSKMPAGQTIKIWCKKYLLEGQSLDAEQAEKVEQLPENPTINDLVFIKYRKWIAMLLPMTFIHIIWWSIAIRYDLFQYYLEYWHMPVVMILGSIIGGMTSEGAGAVAFPVMTLALHIDPTIARDFALMMCRMTSALVCVLFMRVKFETRAVILGCLGAVPGFVIGVHWIDPIFNGPQKKMLFVSIWTAFALSLGILNAQKKRPTFREIPEFCAWKGWVLFFTGIIGGIFDAFAGSGIDICIFSVITLLFRVTEKTATPTTVVLKGTIAVFGFYYRAVMMGDIDIMAWRYFSVTVPISACGGPIGSFLGSHLHRQLIASFVYILEAIALLGFLFTKPGWQLMTVGAVIIIGCFVFFSIVSKFGSILLERLDPQEAKEKELRKLEEQKTETGQQ
ncbi:Protein CBG17977 [Caenorhabditis briggsae]|uniref:Protein CBG17977 n=1 Tax=Caenorhabditis briggsae TaxID=6238 RepID=A8XSQ5_CAEBR|nr:Protein CBG17977 [Caenorhabditis briggsae]CAP35507.2 Protein CBG17977 [Caenorhabditis briggsae]